MFLLLYSDAELTDLRANELSEAPHHPTSNPSTATSCPHYQCHHERPKIVSAYRWEDESNGEIYTDMPLDQGEEVKELPLYVVENGQEFPLLPLSQRKTNFEFVPRLPAQTSALSLTSSVPVSTRPSDLSIVPSSSMLAFEPKVIRHDYVITFNRIDIF